MFIVMNMAVGGWNYVKITDPNDITAPMPAKMCVDWVRLSDNEWTKYLIADRKAKNERRDKNTTCRSGEGVNN